MDTEATEIEAEMEDVLRQFPGLTDAVALDIARQTVAYRNMPAEQKRAMARLYGYEREQVRAEGRYPTW